MSSLSHVDVLQEELEQYIELFRHCVKQTRSNNEKGEIVMLQIERLTEVFVRKGKEIEIC